MLQGGSSVTLARLSNVLKDDYKIDVPVRELARYSLVDLEGLVCGIRKDLSRRDWKAEIEKEWRPLTVKGNGDGSLGKFVLLTGATGFLGVHILEQILSTTKDSVCCIIRAPSNDAAMDRLREACAFYEISLSEASDRIRVLECSSLGEAKLGLSDENYEWLLQSCKSIIHNAATVNGTIPYEGLVKDNVRATVEILKVAAANCAWLIHVGTIGVLSGSGVQDEVEVPVTEMLDRLSGYAQSKLVAEQLVLRAIQEKAVRGVIARVGTVGGRSSGGPCNPKDAVMLLSQGLRMLGAVWPEALPRELPLVAVDRCAWALSALCALKSTGAVRIIHLSGRAVSRSDLVRAIGVRETEGHEWTTLLEGAADERHPLSSMRHALSSAAAPPHLPKCVRAAELLGSLWDQPHCDAQCIASWIDWLQLKK